MKLEVREIRGALLHAEQVMDQIRNEPGRQQQMGFAALLGNFLSFHRQTADARLSLEMTTKALPPGDHPKFLQGWEIGRFWLGITNEVVIR